MQREENGRSHDSALRLKLVGSRRRVSSAPASCCGSRERSVDVEVQEKRTAERTR